MINRASGFTLIEMVIAMVITGIVGGIVAVFIAAPIQGYIDAGRRSAMSDAADGALRRIAYETSRALPNSIRLRSSSSTSVLNCAAGSGVDCYLEYFPVVSGGRYRALLKADGTGNVLDSTVATDTSFDVLGPPLSGVLNGYLVVMNTGQSGLDVYAGENRRTLSGPAGATVSFTAVAGAPFPPYDSPTRRFQIASSAGPVTFGCAGVGVGSSGDGTGTMRRYAAYGINATQAATGIGSGLVLVEKVSACKLAYTGTTMTSGLVVLELTITRAGESVTLHHETYVDNTP